jgi:hypothetical protein
MQHFEIIIIIKGGILYRGREKSRVRRGRGGGGLGGYPYPVLVAQMSEHFVFRLEILDLL